MPSNVVKTPEEERLWEKAKDIAEQQGKAENYAYIMGIFKKMNPDRFKSASQDEILDRIASRVAAKHLLRTAGEVRFVKDTGADWAFSTSSPEKRHIGEFQYNQRKVKRLTMVLRSTMIALGHAMSGYSSFAKLKSAEISPDGSLGGKGYIQSIRDMRKLYMNVIEALSSISDTLYDEVQAPHWSPILRSQPDAEKIMEEVEEVREDPEAWAEESTKDGI